MRWWSFVYQNLIKLIWYFTLGTSPGAYVYDWVSRCHFCLAQCSFGPPSRALVDYHLKIINYWKSSEVLSIWAMGCVVYDCVCDIWLDLTTPRWWREKSWYNFIMCKILWCCDRSFFTRSGAHHCLVLQDLLEGFNLLACDDWLNHSPNCSHHQPASERIIKIHNGSTKVAWKRKYLPFFVGAYDLIFYLN